MLPARSPRLLPRPRPRSEYLKCREEGLWQGEGGEGGVREQGQEQEQEQVCGESRRSAPGVRQWHRLEVRMLEARERQTWVLDRRWRGLAETLTCDLRL